jgi:fatty-acyl-CoA synthase
MDTIVTESIDRGAIAGEAQFYPGYWACVAPQKPALIMGSGGETVSYAQLNDRSNQLAQLLYERGLRRGDHIAVFLQNHPRYLEVVWAALRSGLFLTTVNRYLTADDAGYIINDCDAKAVVTSAALMEVALDIRAKAPSDAVWLMIDGVVDGVESYEAATAGHPTESLAHEPLGDFFLYSSGTTGRPKGIARQLSDKTVTSGPGVCRVVGNLFSMNEDCVYLSTAPLYHSAPLGFCVSTQGLGGTVVMMESFDPEEALRLIERHRVTHSQWVPTMFSRMLKLPEGVRSRYDLGSLRLAIHSAAPCPRPVKEQMFEWFGPIIHEYYGGTELNGMTYASPEDWLAHPGTVGRPVFGTLHICDEDARELPIGETGLVYFELPVKPFEYHKDPVQTNSVQHPDHDNWTRLGDVGRVDQDGFLYLTDRSTFMIISGGVNIYPQEIEDCLISHPKVADVAVFGVPDTDMGEAVKAVVELCGGVEADASLEAELIAFARNHLSHYKCPRSIDFEESLPRLPTGKLYKRTLREKYWAGLESRVV